MDNIEDHGIFNLNKSSDIDMHSKIIQQAGEKMNEPVKELTLEEKFELERKKWGDKIMDMKNKLSSMKTLTDLMMNVIEERQKVIENKHFYLNELSRIDQKIKVMTSEKIEHFTMRHDRKLTAAERDAYVNSALSDIECKRRAVQDQIDFFQDTMKSIDNINFFIKHRIDINEYMKVV